MGGWVGVKQRKRDIAGVGQHTGHQQQLYRSKHSPTPSKHLILDFMSISFNHSFMLTFPFTEHINHNMLMIDTVIKAYPASTKAKSLIEQSTKIRFQKLKSH